MLPSSWSRDTFSLRLTAACPPKRAPEGLIPEGQFISSKGKAATRRTRRTSGGWRQEIPVVTEEHTQDLGYRPAELSVGQAQQQVLAEVLFDQEGSLLGARGAEEVALAGEGSQPVEAARRAPDAGDALAPVSANAECRCGAHDEGEAEPAEGGGVALLVGSLELGEAVAEEPAQGIGSPGTIEGLGALLGRRSVRSGHMKINVGNGHFGLMGSTGADLPAEPRVVA